MRSLWGDLVGQATRENLSGQVSALLFAKRTLSDDPCIWHCEHRRWDVLIAALTGDHEGIFGGGGSLEHGRVSIANKRRTAISSRGELLRLLRASFLRNQVEMVGKVIALASPLR